MNQNSLEQDKQATDSGIHPAPGIPRSLIILWILVFVTILIWAKLADVGWDVAIYHSGIRSLRARHDPYSDATAIQQIFHTQLLANPKLASTQDFPYSYVYSPITLPLLRLIGSIPDWCSGALYYLLYAAAVLAQVWVTLRAAEKNEHPYFRYLAPIAIFFPGLLANGVIMSGNVAYILYALILLAAVLGWQRGTWRWFYLAILAASCVKAPLLSLVLIPVLSVRRQWLAASVTSAVGIALFAFQPLIWPTLFRHYLEAVDLQFRYNRDFGCSPAGLFGGMLYDQGIPYSPGSMLFFLLYAIPLLGFLIHLSRHYLRGSFSLQQWMPVLLVGVILLNPRIIEYDTAPIALPLGLIAWRFFASWTTPPRAILYLGVLFAIANVIGAQTWSVRKLTDGLLLVLFFAAGSWNLLQRAGEAGNPALSVDGAVSTARTELLFR